MRVVLGAIGLSLVLLGCSHPLEIVGEGDILSASGDRDCLFEDELAGADNCAENLVVEAYDETYYGVARPGWHFHRWANYCQSAPGNECSFEVSAGTVEAAWGKQVAPLVAIFRPDINTGFNALFIGHSFFKPYAESMNFHAGQAGFSDHDQTTVFNGGANGAPQALWENPSKQAQIQGVLDGGDIDLFGMTYHPEYPTMEGYRNWVNYALARNPDTRFFIAMPWEPYPANTDAATYESNWHLFHPGVAHGIVDTLRQEYPGVDFYCVPYGQGAVELRLLFAGSNLPEVDQLVGSGNAIYRDSLGHADDILLDLGELVWLRAIYGVDLLGYPAQPGYLTDLNSIAQAIMDGHDPEYNAP